MAADVAGGADDEDKGSLAHGYVSLTRYYKFK
jgi:hypothetical protein